ncbi:MAG: hypothetical protein ACRDH9_04760 [Actinomycetota bacterium]
MSAGSRSDSGEEAPAQGWLFLRPGPLPRRWRDRAIQVTLVPLGPEEASELMEASGPAVDLDPVDEDLAHLTAQGLTVTAMAGRLSLSARSVNRRLARLRQQFGVGSTAELAVALARRGY